MPETESPQPPKRVEEERAVLQPTEIDMDEYHTRADDYMDAVNEKAEAIQEGREDVEVEFAVSYPASISNTRHQWSRAPRTHCLNPSQ